MDAAVKAGLALEQSKLKQENMNSDKKLEKEVRALSKQMKKKKPVKVDCDTCTFPTHASGKCPAKDLDCFDCRETGHFSGSKACKKKEVKGTKPKKPTKTRKVKEKETEESNTSSESSYRVRVLSPERTTVRALKGKSVDEVTVQVSALDHDTESKKAEVKLIVDTGVNCTLISEEVWGEPRPRKGERDPKLRKIRRDSFHLGQMED